ncbi:hypothetical protein CQA49_07580 [Helicobacter sp. MIT 00-7814]|uniref:hypothetical protein n=1 Tax=unclassified Helicobacter TaxID=2593540 RepID=UPI000E1E38DB|nr:MULTISPECIES: hypothetical protein [unclassified Helicobacter]RDU52580.1 hypothetical protein CQA37_08265 [Helicobacter sp. MIT 99-10781]RDU52880.1 hypothetical protein CQA49_07580 [Helicobacter sp. MIT 00-7814]
MLLSIVLSERAREASNKEKFCEFLNLAKLLSWNLRSWASCDIFTPKIRQEFCEEYFNFLLELSANKGEFISRLGIVGMLAFIPQKSSKILEHLQKIDSEFYYVNMAIAWVFSIIFIKENARILADSAVYKVLKNRTLAPFVHNKTISKICDSYRVNKDTKDILKTLRVKK